MTMTSAFRLHLHIIDTEKDNDPQLQAQQDEWEGREEEQEWADHFGWYEADLEPTTSILEPDGRIWEGTVTIAGRQYQIELRDQNLFSPITGTHIKPLSV